jgi:hypothetical protein
MGISIHYRGRLEDMSRIEDFEDRVIDLALALGGNVRLWRSANNGTPTRMVRGLFVDLAPGQETTSLLVSPEGWLINLMEIADAEKGKLTEPSWCWVKTQFGPLEGHVALVELLSALKSEFLPNLEVSDEGGYWERRDLAELRQKMQFLERAIDTLADAFANDHLSAEAAEDPEILATRVERLAKKVHAIISRPAEHPPVEFPQDTGEPVSQAENEACWDAMFEENRRRQERMQRVIEEEMAKGVEIDDALDAAIEEVVPQLDWLEDSDEVESDQEFYAEAGDAPEEADDEPWLESLPDEVRSDRDEDDSFAAMEKHPLQQAATDLLMKLYDIAKALPERTTNFDALMRSAGEITGGLAQALPPPIDFDADDVEIGLTIVQLKRALRGAAFVRGALFLVRADKLLSEGQFADFMGATGTLSRQILEVLRAQRRSHD